MDECTMYWTVCGGQIDKLLWFDLMKYSKSFKSLFEKVSI